MSEKKPSLTLPELIKHLTKLRDTVLEDAKRCRERSDQLRVHLEEMNRRQAQK